MAATSRTFVSKLGWLDTPFPSGYSLTYLGMIPLAVLCARPAPAARLPLAAKAWLLGCFLLSVILLEMSLYMVVSPLASDVIYGLQGRYLILLVSLAVFGLYSDWLQLLSNRRAEQVYRIFPRLVFAWLAFGYVLVVVVLLQRYYGLAVWAL